MSTANLRGSAAYQRIGVETRVMQPSQYELANMMFEVTLDSLIAARGAMVAGNVSEKVRLINKAFRIIQDGLRTSLDIENGGELAANLDALYDYCVVRLTQANAANNPDMLEEVVNLLKPVADAWKQMRSGTSNGAEVEAIAAESKAVPVIPPKTAPVARRVDNAYGQGMAWAGA